MLTNYTEKEIEIIKRNAFDKGVYFGTVFMLFIFSVLIGSAIIFKIL